MKLRITSVTEKVSKKGSKYLDISDSNGNFHRIINKEIFPHIRNGAEIEAAIQESFYNGRKNSLIVGVEAQKPQEVAAKPQVPFIPRYTDSPEFNAKKHQSIEAQASAHDAAEIVSALIAQGTIKDIDAACTAFLLVANTVNEWVKDRLSPGA